MHLSPPARWRLPGAVRDRRRRRARHPGWRVGGGDLAAGADHLPARRQRAAAPAHPQRGCGQPAARRRPGRGGLDHRPGRRRRHRGRRAGTCPGPQPRQTRLHRGAGGSRRRAATRPDRAAARDRRPADRPRAAPGRHQPAAARAGSGARRRRLAAGAARAGADGRAQRPDLPADRDGRRRHHAGRPGRVCCGRCRRRSRRRCSGCGPPPRRWACTGRTTWARVRSSPVWTPPSRAPPRSSTRRPS